MSYTYSENTLIQESAGNLLQNELGWQVEYAYNKEVLGKSGTFGRRDYRQIILSGRSQGSKFLDDLMR